MNYFKIGQFGALLAILSGGSISLNALLGNNETIFYLLLIPAVTGIVLGLFCLINVIQQPKKHYLQDGNM